MINHLLILIFVLFLSVRKALAEGLRDVRPPVDFPPNYFVLFLTLVLIFGILTYLFIRFIRKRIASFKQEPRRPPKEPWEVASEALEKLRALNLPSQGKIKEYFEQLSYIIRCYIEGRFLIHAPEMTTEEFLESLKEAQALTDAQKESLGEFLRCSDLVKFAKHVSSQAEADRSFVLAKKFIDETKMIEIEREHSLAP